MPEGGWRLKRVTSHPGEILREEFLKPLGLSGHRLALALRVPADRMSKILNEERGITVDTALRLARFFNTTPDFWLNLQTAHDLSKARAEFGARIEDDVRPFSREGTRS